MGNVFSCCVHEEKVPEQKPVVRGSSNRKIVTEQVIEQEKKSSEAQFNKKSVASKSMSKPQEEEPPFEYAPALENQALNSEASVLSDQTSEDAVQPDHFEKHKVGPAHKIIGKGAYGTVYLVTRKDDLDKTPLAMKEIIKANMKQKNQMVFLQRERDMLVTFKSPFIVDLKCCMQDEGKVYFVFEFMAGGDLYHHLKESRRFGEQRARFYAAQLVLAIEYLHKLGIIYRDLKPENILMDERGYIKLSDFGLSKQTDHTSTFCGTADYLAPEMVAGNKHNKNIDWWMLVRSAHCRESTSTKCSPDRLPSPAATRCRSAKKSKRYPPLTQAPVPAKSDLSKDALDLVRKLLDKDPEKRLGNKGDSKEIKEHPFFAPIDWDQLARRELEPLFKPDVGQDLLNCFKKVKQEEKSVDNNDPNAPTDSFDENKLPGFTYHADTFKEKLKHLDLE